MKTPATLNEETQWSRPTRSNIINPLFIFILKNINSLELQLFWALGLSLRRRRLSDLGGRPVRSTTNTSIGLFSFATGLSWRLCVSNCRRRCISSRSRRCTTSDFPYYLAISSSCCVAIIVPCLSRDEGPIDLFQNISKLISTGKNLRGGEIENS